MDWKLLESKIIATVNRVAEKHYQTYNEVWLTDDKLHLHISVMTKRWLRDHGHMVPRTQIEWDDEKGHHASSFMYPLHQIQAMLEDGRIKQLKSAI